MISDKVIEVLARRIMDLEMMIAKKSVEGLDELKKLREENERLKKSCVLYSTANRQFQSELDQLKEAAKPKRGRPPKKRGPGRPKKVK